MAENNIKLFQEFPPITTEDWQNKIIVDLKGANFEKKLVWRTNEGFNVQPYYRQEDLESVNYLNTLPGQFPYTRGNNTKGNDWFVRQDIKVNDLEEANKKALEVLQKGITSLGFVFEGDIEITVSHLEVLLKGICLDAIEVNLVTCKNDVTNAEALAGYIAGKYGANSGVKASVTIDPLGDMTSNGSYNDQVIGKLKQLIEATEGLSQFTPITVNGKLFRDSGSSIVQEVAFSLAIGAEYLSQLSEGGADVAVLAPKIKFNLGVGANYFMEIAKLRAARTLWAKIVEAFDPKCDCNDDCCSDDDCKDGICRCAGKMNIHSENTIFNKTVYDPHVNLLRTQTEAMSAALGGTNSMTVTPFNAAYEETTEFSERIARNQQILLKEESHLDKIADPSAGSYYIENLTANIMEQAWSLFLEVQDRGGYIEAFKAGFVQEQVETTADKLDKAIAIRRENLLGVNQFPNFNEYMQSELDVEIFSKHNCKSEYAIAEPLKQYRGAQAFEALRYASDVYSKENKRPLVFMLTIGNVAFRKARAQFAANFFAVAGFAVQEGKGYRTVEEGVADAKAAGANMVVICSSDDEYAEFAPIVKAALTDEIFVVAGNPSCKEELEGKGIENFIHVRSNLLEELQAYQKQLIK